jgi:hypothetical protein
MNDKERKNKRMKKVPKRQTRSDKCEQHDRSVDKVEEGRKE